MSVFFLQPHSDSCSPIATIEVGAKRSAAEILQLSFSVAGALDGVIFPSSEPAARADDLWQHTCFEAFIAAEHGYYEFNFSPSSQWAAYHFDGYREGRREAPLPDPAIAWIQDGNGVRLIATIPLPPDAAGPIGLSAVIEATDGSRSYWALAHPPGKPDFHAAACFTGQLPPAG